MPAVTAFDPDQVIETFEAAKEENQLNRLRQGQVVHLCAEGEVWMTGDVHDHRTNFAKLVKAADLGNHPHRHLVLHELIHGDYYDANNADGSWQILHKAAELKFDHPNQVHFLLANHDLAQIHGEGIMKAGLSVCEAFNAGVRRDFGDRGTNVNVAITEFLLSFPLAVRCPNGLFFSHSLPTDEQMQDFDWTIFDRDLDGVDYRKKSGPVYQLIWGRNITPGGAEYFAEKVGAKLLVTGHQPQDNGYLVNGERHLILASDHGQGVFLPVDLTEEYIMPQLVKRLVKFVALEG